MISDRRGIARERRPRSVEPGGLTSKPREGLMLGWFQALMPKEERFFELFTRHSRILVEGAEALRGLLEGGERVEHHCNEIVRLEHDADEITREVLLAVRRTFITPFDRGDIRDLIASMDDAIDQMHQTAKAIRLFEVDRFAPPMREMGEIDEERLEVLRQADRIFIEEIKKGGVYDDIWQAFCVFVPVKTVGVMGDERTYENVIALRAVPSQDGMTAKWARIPYDLLEKISVRIINEVGGVNRVVYDVSTKPPSTIEWE